jgi:glycosyltransferase involved in cell wall biosynthesis
MRPFLAPPAQQPIARTEPPSISVLIPVYNAAATVTDAIDSLVAQTAPAEEIIVCDDGSTDNLDAALSTFRERIHYLRKPNGGGASALNAAVAVATSEFVALLDADDVYLPERIEALRELAALRPDLDVISTDAYFEVNGRVTGRFNQENPFPTTEQRRAMLRSCYIVTPAIRRERLLEVGCFDEALATGYDWDCWIRLLNAGMKIGLVDEPLMRYRLRAGSLTSDRLANFEARIAVLSKASTSTDLSRSERSTLENSLADYRARVRSARVEAALAAGSRDLRRCCLALAVERGSPWRSRLRALVAALAPAPTGRRLASSFVRVSSNG